MQRSHAIEISDLRKSYGEREVLKGVNLTVERGDMLALLGPNGAGKTTTVKILTTLTAPSGGTATVNGFDVARDPGRVRSSIGLVNQFMALDYVHSGRENLVMLGRLQHIGRAAAKRRADELLEQFDLVEAADRPVNTYSGGMRRRLDLAISLITSPPVVFLDEPTTGLDPRSRNVLWDAIRELLDGGSTILLTTQYLEEADELADRVAVIDDGRIVAHGTATELKERVGTERMQVEFATDADFQTARALVDDEGLHWDREASRLSLATSDIKHLIWTLDRVERAGAEIANLSLDQPSLDDVFLRLTQRTPEPAPAEGILQK
ncbi:ATP-binding cassette domain-containing protein [Actinomadura rudentiformis]|uniref:ATP-binding cassette domain-containing protein n=1 Tax=Actinomadura rudentiformis TaxID=359158 RepID=A0A6H9YJ81_9ACTN|nr:ATP-binding cassette domain-containing protein [Actinomadura rudentiformis]KAB2346145.1 ATP-binding cassette domain-containing protein [Actinomadura rudentiformis]